MTQARREVKRPSQRNLARSSSSQKAQIKAGQEPTDSSSAQQNKAVSQRKAVRESESWKRLRKNDEAGEKAMCRQRVVVVFGDGGDACNGRGGNEGRREGRGREGASRGGAEWRERCG